MRGTGRDAGIRRICRRIGLRFRFIGRLGRGLRGTAWSEDGVVESVEHKTLPLVCVQFHPERMTGALARTDTVDGGALFRVFLELCR